MSRRVRDIEYGLSDEQLIALARAPQISINEAAARSGLSRHSITQLIRDREIPYPAHYGRKTLIPEPCLEAYIAGRIRAVHLETDEHLVDPRAETRRRILHKLINAQLPPRSIAA